MMSWRTWVQDPDFIRPGAIVTPNGTAITLWRQIASSIINQDMGHFADNEVGLVIAVVKELSPADDFSTRWALVLTSTTFGWTPVQDLRVGVMSEHGIR